VIAHGIASADAGGRDGTTLRALVEQGLRKVVGKGRTEDSFVLRPGRVVGPKVHDARIVALSLQHGVRELWSADRDFSLFPKLKVVNPLVV